MNKLAYLCEKDNAMFYAFQGQVYVTEIGRLQPEWLQVESSGMDIGLCIKYMWWMYRDGNEFQHYAEKDRLLEVQKRIGASDSVYKKVQKVCEVCVLFYKMCQLNSMKQNRNAMREKQSQLRDMYMKEVDPKKMLDIEKALKSAEMREQEYEIAIEIAGEDGMYAEACPINLFSLPQKHLPVHLRVVL
jgi:hypothetical protein